MQRILYQIHYSLFIKKWIKLKQEKYERNEKEVKSNAAKKAIGYTNIRLILYSPSKHIQDFSCSAIETFFGRQQKTNISFF